MIKGTMKNQRGNGAEFAKYLKRLFRVHDSFQKNLV